MVRLDGPTSDQLAVALDPLPPDAPVTVWHRPTAQDSPAAAVVAVLRHLEHVALAVFPAWLPDADGLAHSDLDRRGVRAVARRAAAVSDHFGPFLADLAEAAVAQRSPASGHSPEVRARGLAGVLAAAYDRTAVALLVDSGCGDPQADAHCAAALRWLADHAGIGAWLLADALATVDRFPTITLPVPEYVRRLAPRGVVAPADYPPPAGRPHPASTAESLLETALARCEWAAGRAWNQTHQSHPLSRQIRVDLVWPAARLVVELDGPDHRGRLKYADDRRRDNALVQEGFVVLRFTNEDVADDLSQVLGIIERVLTSRRGDSDDQSG